MKQPLRAVLLMTAALSVAAAAAREGDPAAGRQVYASKMCNLCHTVDGESGPMAELGGPLDGVGLRRDAAWLRLYFTDPKSAIPAATMPKAALTEQELTDLIAYLLSLR